MNNTQASTPHSTFTARAAEFEEILRGARDHADAPTPCEGWTVRDVVAHVIDTERDFLVERGLPVAARPGLADPHAAWQAHTSEVERLLTPEVGSQEYDGYFGRTTVGETMGSFYGWDLVLHGSDVARASGQPWSVTDDEAAALRATAEGWGPGLYAEGICAPAVDVPADASATDRLLGFVGRDPAWRPAS